MDIGDYYWGPSRGGHYRDPFPHSLLRTRQKKEAPRQSVKELLTETFIKKPGKELLKGTLMVLLMGTLQDLQGTFKGTLKP